MATAQDLINSSAKQAGILAEGQTLESGINTDALSRLNRMIARMQNSGIDLGLSTLAASDTLYIDDADEEALELGLTVRLMIRHKRNISSGLGSSLTDAMTELRAKYYTITPLKIDDVMSRKPIFNITDG